MGLFNFFKKKEVVEEVTPVAEAVVTLNVDPEELNAKIVRLNEVITEFERAHEDDQVIINVMSNELNAIKKTLEESRDSYLQTYEENERLKRFYNYFNDLRGKKLEVTNWHRLKPMEDYIDAAEKAMEDESHNVE